MKRLPTLLAAVFIVITLVRVASFSGVAMQAGWLGWVFSIGLGASVYLSAYWMRISAVNRNGEEDVRSIRVRKMAAPALVLFVVADGLFNLWDVLRVVKDPALQGAAYIYGAFPTLAVALLGALQGFVDRIPTPPKAQRKRSLRIVMVEWIDHALNGPQEAEALPQPNVTLLQSAPIPIDLAFRCPRCGRKFEKQQGLAAHLRRCPVKINAKKAKQGTADYLHSYGSAPIVAASRPDKEQK